MSEQAVLAITFLGLFSAGAAVGLVLQTLVFRSILARYEAKMSMAVHVINALAAENQALKQIVAQQENEGEEWKQH